MPARPAPLASGQQAFDLTIEKVLEHWPVAFAVRELIANALDETAITGCADPDITKTTDGDWLIRDYGRGLRHRHLTQKENTEKLQHPDVIGQFGIGLKDALAVFDRRHVGVSIRSAHASITTAQRAKAGFPDVVTLHAVVRPADDPAMVGTEVRLHGISDTDIETAKSFFLYFGGATPVETTRYGQVLAKDDPKAAGSVYVKGLLVAQEPNFLFSYNVTSLNAALRRALNRERSNVGRSAYSERVKEILKDCRSADVAGPLAGDLGRFTRGGMHDELAWKDVAVHACRILQTAEKVLFVTVTQLGLPAVHYARDDGYRILIAPDDIVGALSKLTDLDGRPMFDLFRFNQEWNDSFAYTFIETDQLSPAEQAVYALTGPAATLAGVDLPRASLTVAVSETMRLSDRGTEILGVWEPAERRIVVRRDQLADPVRWCATLLHELTHAISGTVDLSFAFEDALTVALGTVAHTAIAAGATPAAPKRVRRAVVPPAGGPIASADHPAREPMPTARTSLV
jgi:hypothetical protein